MNFFEKLTKTVEKNDSLFCVGLDTDITKIPQHLLQDDDPIFRFNKEIIDATHDLVCAYKPNIAYYEAEGVKGIESLKKTVVYLQRTYADIPIICDAKRGDIGSTAEKYAENLFHYFNFDAATANPYMGFDALKPFLQYEDKGVIILVRTSNPGASDFQDLLVGNEPFYMKVAKQIVAWNQEYGNCLMVVGATWPKQLGEIRQFAPDMVFLVPGIGSQGGDLEKTVKIGLRKDKTGLIINSSRGILYVSQGEDFAEQAREEAQKIRDEINIYR